MEGMACANTLEMLSTSISERIFRAVYASVNGTSNYASSLHLDINIAAFEAVAQDRHDLINVLGVHLSVTHFDGTHRFAVLGKFSHQIQTFDAHGRVLGASSYQEGVKSGPLILKGAHLHDHVADGTTDTRLWLILENI